MQPALTPIRHCQDADTPNLCAIINDAALAYRGVIPAGRGHELYMSLEELTQEISRSVKFRGQEVTHNWSAKRKNCVLAALANSSMAD